MATTASARSERPGTRPEALFKVAECDHSCPQWTGGFWCRTDPARTRPAECQACQAPGWLPCLGPAGVGMEGLAALGEATAVPSEGDTDDDVLDRLWRLAAQAIEHADQVLHDGGQTAAAAEEPHRRATGARERAALAKRRELAAHLRAIEVHERAAELQERLGYPDRAARARAHAGHARELYARAREEQQEHERVDASR